MGSQSQTQLSDFYFTDLGANGVHLGFESHVHMCVLSRALGLYKDCKEETNETN